MDSEHQATVAAHRAARAVEFADLIRGRVPPLNKALDAVCVKAQRNPSSIRRSISVRFTTADQTLKSARASIDAGFTELLVMMGGGSMPTADPRKRAQEAAALLPRLRALG